MTFRRALTLALLPLAGAALSGCVAVAIPLVAGGALARTATDDEPGPVAEVEPAPAQAVKSAPDAASGLETLSNSAPAEAIANPIANQPSPSASMQSPQLEQFVRYSTSRAFAFTQQREVLTTAVLIEPSALDGRRRACAPGDERAPAILIDLDPGDDRFTEESPLPAPGTVALSLKVLRAEGVTIAWISENSAADADIIREALTTSGLDPKSEDTLLLMRYPGDRKQTRREEFAAETCLIAIAGDERRDFDELYDYLVNPDAALELERLINNGWFLIGPGTPAQTPPADASPEAQPAPEPDGDQEQ